MVLGEANGEKLTSAFVWWAGLNAELTLVCT